MPGVRRFLLMALPLLALVMSSCGVKDDALGKACDDVDDAVSNALINRREMAAFGASLAQWAKDGDQSTKSALAPLAESANVYARAPNTQRAASKEQFWEAFGELAHKCEDNGTPVNP